MASKQTEKKISLMRKLLLERPMINPPRSKPTTSLGFPIPSPSPPSIHPRLQLHMLNFDISSSNRLPHSLSKQTPDLLLRLCVPNYNTQRVGRPLATKTTTGISSRRFIRSSERSAVFRKKKKKDPNYFDLHRYISCLCVPHLLILTSNPTPLSHRLSLIPVRQASFFF